jgi:hypothetical protein
MRVKPVPTRRNRAVDRRWKWHMKLGNLKWLACLGDYGSPEQCVRGGYKWAEEQNLRVNWVKSHEELLAERRAKLRKALRASKAP